MSAKKLVVSTYLQYILIAVGALLLFTFVRQLGGVLLTFLLAAVLAYMLNPLVRKLEAWRVPRVIAVLGVFVALVVAVLVALLLLILPAVGQVQALVQNPKVLTDGVARFSDWARELPYVGERIEAVDQAAITQFLQSNAPSAGQVLNGALGFIGGVFGVFGTILNLLLMLIISIYLLLLPPARQGEGLGRHAPGGAGNDKGPERRALPRRRGRPRQVSQGAASTVRYHGGPRLGHRLLYLRQLRAPDRTLGRRHGDNPRARGLSRGGPGGLDSDFLGRVGPGYPRRVALPTGSAARGERLVPRIMGSSVGVHPLWVLFATLAATALYGLVGAVFAVPIVAIIAAVLRYLNGMLLFERWQKAPVMEVAAEGDQKVAVSGGEPAGLRGSAGGEG